MKTFILSFVTACAILSAGSMLIPVKPRVVVAPIVKPVSKDIIICGNHWPPCNSDPSGDCSGCNTLE